MPKPLVMTYHYQLFVIFSFISLVLCRDTELTIFVSPTATSCFFETAAIGDILETQYQVVNADQGDYDIGLIIYDPVGTVVLVDFKRSSDVHRTEIKSAGDYKICFDNSASHYSTKVVYFSVAIENDNDDDDEYEKQFSLSDVMTEDNYEIKVDEIKTAVKGVHDRLGKAINFQDQIKAFMARDRSVVEHNFERVNFYSTVSICVMLFVGAIQIIMVRSLFDEKSKFHKFFKTLY